MTLSADDRVDSAVTTFFDVPDEIFLGHLIPKLGVSARVLLSNVDRRTRALVHSKRDQLRLCDCLNSVAMITWARENGCPWDESTCAAAAEGGWLEALKWMTCFGGRLEVLEWVRAQSPPCPWDVETCDRAAGRGYLNVLKWLRSRDPPCPWNAWTCAMAEKGGHFEMLQWAHERGCPGVELVEEEEDFGYDWGELLFEEEEDGTDWGGLDIDRYGLDCE